jgi:hypothetical protein
MTPGPGTPGPTPPVAAPAPKTETKPEPKLPPDDSDDPFKADAPAKPAK